MNHSPFEYIDTFRAEVDPMAGEPGLAHLKQINAVHALLGAWMAGVHEDSDEILELHAFGLPRVGFTQHERLFSSSGLLHKVGVGGEVDSMPGWVRKPGTTIGHLHFAVHDAEIVDQLKFVLEGAVRDHFTVELERSTFADIRASNGAALLLGSTNMRGNYFPHGYEASIKLSTGLCLNSMGANGLALTTPQKACYLGGQNASLAFGGVVLGFAKGFSVFAGRNPDEVPPSRLPYQFSKKILHGPWVTPQMGG